MRCTSAGTSGSSSVRITVSGPRTLSITGCSRITSRMSMGAPSAANASPLPSICGW